MASLALNNILYIEIKKLIIPNKKYDTYISSLYATGPRMKLITKEVINKINEYIDNSKKEDKNYIYMLRFFNAFLFNMENKINIKFNEIIGEILNKSNTEKCKYGERLVEKIIKGKGLFKKIKK